MPIPEQFIDELVARSEISDVVSSYVHLTRKGNNLWGLCPFHNEKTPSFSVSPDKQIYHCFGCGKGGGVISFIMEIENLPFPDAVRLLAQRAGLEVPDTGADDAGRKKRARALAANRDAARFYHDYLKGPGGARVRDCDWSRNSAGRRPLPRLSTESNKNAAGHKQMFAICEGMCYTENETRNLGKRSVCHVLFGAIHGAKRDRELPGDGGGGLPPRAAAV